MKTCPICKATCFDDMDVCYGCLHRFDAEPTLDIPAIEPSSSMQQRSIIDEPRGRHRVRESSCTSGYSGSSVETPPASTGQTVSAPCSSCGSVEQTTALAQHDELPNWIPIAVLGGGQEGIAMPSAQNKNGTAMQYRLVLGLQPVQV